MHGGEELIERARHRRRSLHDPHAPAPNPGSSSFTIRVGASVRQTGHEGQITLSPAECVQYASQSFPLRPGDVVFTGTPAGVGPVAPGDEAELAWGEQPVARVRWT